MTLTSIAQSSSNFQSQESTVIYEYALTVANTDDTQELTAAFTFIPNAQDWQQWLNGWSSCGYSLQSTPQLVHIL